MLWDSLNSLSLLNGFIVLRFPRGQNWYFLQVYRYFLLGLNCACRTGILWFLICLRWEGHIFSPVWIDPPNFLSFSCLWYLDYPLNRLLSASSTHSIDLLPLFLMFLLSPKGQYIDSFLIRSSSSSNSSRTYRLLCFLKDFEDQGLLWRSSWFCSFHPLNFLMP